MLTNSWGSFQSQAITCVEWAFHLWMGILYRLALSGPPILVSTAADSIDSGWVCLILSHTPRIIQPFFSLCFFGFCCFPLSFESRSWFLASTLLKPFVSAGRWPVSAFSLYKSYRLMFWGSNLGNWAFRAKSHLTSSILPTNVLWINKGMGWAVGVHAFNSST